MIKEVATVDEEVLLDEAQARASQQAAQMRNALESGNMREAIKFADQMLDELRNPLISPKSYYYLCK